MTDHLTSSTTTPAERKFPMATEYRNETIEDILWFRQTGDTVVVDHNENPDWAPGQIKAVRDEMLKVKNGGMWFDEPRKFDGLYCVIVMYEMSIDLASGEVCCEYIENSFCELDAWLDLNKAEIDAMAQFYSDFTPTGRK